MLTLLLAVTLSASLSAALVSLWWHIRVRELEAQLEEARLAMIETLEGHDIVD